MSHLTDSQLVILSNAAQAEDGSILPLPDFLATNGGAVAAVLSSLLRKGLIEEWRLQGPGSEAVELHGADTAPFSARHSED